MSREYAGVDMGLTGDFGLVLWYWKYKEIAEISLGMEISNDNRCEIAQVIDNALQDSGRWTVCRYIEDMITIHAVVDDQEQARSVIRSAIEGHPVFLHNFTDIMTRRIICYAEQDQ